MAYEKEFFCFQMSTFIMVRKNLEKATKKYLQKSDTKNLKLEIRMDLTLLLLLMLQDLAEPGITFFQWCRFSPIRAQISRELVRLITLIDLEKF